MAAYGVARSLKTDTDCARFQGRLDALDSLTEALVGLDNFAKETRNAQVEDDPDDPDD